MNKLRAAVLQRCQGYCERCGIPLENDFALHHRKLRSRGGKDELPNLLALHHHCHNLGTNSVHLKPQQATEDGFLVASWDDPAEIPIRLHEASKVYLTVDGNYLLLEDGYGNTHNSSW